MARDLQPGDLAMVHLTNRGWVRAMWMDGCEWETPYADSDGQTTYHRNYPSEVRPLAVIDPEREEQVERLAEAILRNDRHNGAPCYSTTCHVERLAQSLRDFAIVKPDEPAKIGAVVEDVEGHLWTRARTNVSGWVASHGLWREWDRVDAVKVLSEGVTP